MATNDSSGRNPSGNPTITDIEATHIGVASCERCAGTALAAAGPGAASLADGGVGHQRGPPTGTAQSHQLPTDTAQRQQ